MAAVTMTTPSYEYLLEKVGPKYYQWMKHLGRHGHHLVNDPVKMSAQKMHRAIWAIVVLELPQQAEGRLNSLSKIYADSVGGKDGIFDIRVQHIHDRKSQQWIFQWDANAEGYDIFEHQDFVAGEDDDLADEDQDSELSVHAIRWTLYEPEKVPWPKNLEGFN